MGGYFITQRERPLMEYLLYLLTSMAVFSKVHEEEVGGNYRGSGWTEGSLLRDLLNTQTYLIFK